jgi:drug/metabolite transporter (DMT)-like permease
MMAAVGVAGTQVAYFAAVQRIPVGTAVLIEYLAPLLLVAVVWARTRKAPKVVVLIGSALALVGLVMVVSPRGDQVFDGPGISFALIAMVGCAVYYVVAARPGNGLPPVALAGFGLLLGGLMLGVLGLIGVLPFTATFGTVEMLGTSTPWWVPLLVVGVLGTAIAYSASITASEILGSRLASFVGLLEVVAATFYAWLLLGEQLTAPQFAGGLLILLGIGFVRSDTTDAPLEPASIALTEPTDPRGVITER